MASGDLSTILNYHIVNGKSTESEVVAGRVNQMQQSSFTSVLLQMKKFGLMERQG